MNGNNCFLILRRLNWLILLVLSFLSVFFMSPSWTLGVLLGGLTIIANFNLTKRTILKAFSSQAPGKAEKGLVILKSYLRLLALGIIIFILLMTGLVDPVGLAVGLSTIVLSITTLGIIMAVKLKTGEAI